MKIKYMGPVGEGVSLDGHDVIVAGQVIDEASEDRAKALIASGVFESAESTKTPKKGEV